MITPDEESDLRARFESLREADAGIDPGFERVRGRQPLAPSATWRRWAPALAAAAAAAALWLTIPGSPEPSTPPDPPQFALGRWTMPTDVLLDLSGLPGDDLLRELPDLGAPPAEDFDRPSGARSHESRTSIRRHTV